MRSTPTIGVVVPTIGASPYLRETLESLRRDGGDRVRIVLVHQGERPLPDVGGWVEEVLRLESNLGFAAATNRGLQRVEGDLVALVNDDVIVEAGWLGALVAAFEVELRLAAAQGVNLRLEAPERVDGCGIGWNSSWQAVQLGHDELAPAAESPPREVFGVSATAALYRRAALDAIALPGGQVLDETLGSYYEDVDLAIRLRAAQWNARVVPAARARHAGSTTGARRPVRRWTQIYGNRLLVLSRMLGADVRAVWPEVLRRDLRDLAGACLRFDGARALGILFGWGRAVRARNRSAPSRAPLIPLGELARWRAENTR